jgi:cytochrome c biogenesis protein CcmG/thiol:disulfide interchange protein DsbE
MLVYIKKEDFSMPRKHLIWPLILALGIFSLSACKTKTEKPVPPGEEPRTATEAPEGFSLISASEFKVENYKGRVLVLDFWATWCGPCKMEIPHLIELQEKYRDQGLTVVGITYDDNPDKDVPPYAAEVGMNYVNVRADDALKSKYAVIGLPTIIIYDRDGNEVMKRPGYIEKDQLEAKITPLLAPASS